MHGFGRLILVAVLGLVAALWTWTRPGGPGLYPAAVGRPAVEAWLLDNGFHTDLVVPRAAFAGTSGPLTDAVDALGPGDWILIGWGDAKFYVDQRPIGDRLPDGARAFFAPGNPSVLMLRPETIHPERAFVPEGRRRILLSPEGFGGMRRRIENSLDLSTGVPRIAATRPGDPVRFYASRETFSVLHLCNHWTAEVLNAAGLPVRPARAITSAEIIASVDRASIDRAN